MSFASWLASCIVFLFVCLASSRIAVFFPLIGLPLITGHLFVGALAGPFVLGVVQTPDVASLGFVTQFALSYIAFSAGSELCDLPFSFPHRNIVTLLQLLARASISLPQHSLPNNFNRIFQFHHLRLDALRHRAPHPLAPRHAAPLPRQYLLHRRQHHGCPLPRQRHRSHKRVARQGHNDIHTVRRYRHVRRLRFAPLYPRFNRHGKHVRGRRVQRRIPWRPLCISRLLLDRWMDRGKVSHSAHVRDVLFPH
jgi:hypothetical protein